MIVAEDHLFSAEKIDFIMIRFGAFGGIRRVLCMIAFNEGLIFVMDFRSLSGAKMVGHVSCENSFLIANTGPLLDISFGLEHFEQLGVEQTTHLFFLELGLGSFENSGESVDIFSINFVGGTVEPTCHLFGMFIRQRENLDSIEL